MLNNPTIEKLKDMKLHVIAQMLHDDIPVMRDLTFEERLGIMVEKEWMSRKNARIHRLLKAASFSLQACMEDIDYTVERKMDKQTMQKLATCTFIMQHLNVVITGKTGSGKSFAACAIGHSACRHGYTVKYYRIPELLLEIQEAKQENRYSKYMEQLKNVKLLILDDIGLKSYTLEESRDIFEIAESRCNQSSTILCSQMESDHWYELFPDPTVADGIMDRLIHQAYVLKFDSKQSMRQVMAERVFQEIKGTIANE
jgi:DNA replication protein DnaC